MRDEEQIRERIEELEDRLKTYKNHVIGVAIRSQIDALKWVLGEDDIKEE